MLQETLHSPGIVLENENGEARPVTDVIETVLSSVRVVRAASAFGRGEEQARFSWTSLITILGITISENVYLAYGIQISFFFVLMNHLQGRCFFLEAANHNEAEAQGQN